jgi:hypothetical protein
VVGVVVGDERALERVAFVLDVLDEPLRRVFALLGVFAGRAFMPAALGAVAELERSLTVERVRAGLRNERAKGKRLGRPRVTVDAARITAPRTVKTIFPLASKCPSALRRKQSQFPMP